MGYRIFISYRRADSQMATGRIYDRLRSEYGAAAVFKDVDDIPLGSDFRKILADAVNQSDVLLAVIGKEWVDIKDDQGNRRLENPNDFVRIEIESALERDLMIIPLFIDGRQGISANKLPESLQELAFRNAIQIRPDPDFHKDVDRLIRALGESFKNADALREENTTALQALLADFEAIDVRVAALAGLTAIEKGLRARLQKQFATAKQTVTHLLADDARMGRAVAMASYRQPLDALEEDMLALEERVDTRQRDDKRQQDADAANAAQRDLAAQAAVDQQAADEAANDQRESEAARQREQRATQQEKTLRSLVDDASALQNKLALLQTLDAAEKEEHASISTRLTSFIEELTALLADKENLTLDIDLSPHQQRVDRLTQALTTLQDQQRARLRTEKETDDRKEKEQREAERVRKSLTRQRDDLQKMLDQLGRDTQQDALADPFKEAGADLGARLQALIQQLDDALESLPPQVSDATDIESYEGTLAELKLDVSVWRKQVRASQPRNLTWAYVVGGIAALALLAWGIYWMVDNGAFTADPADVARAEVVTEAPAGDDVVSVPNEKFVTAQNWEQVVLFNERGVIQDIALSPDGSLLAVASSTGVWLYEYPSFEYSHGLATEGTISSVSWSPDSSQIAIGSWNSNVLILTVSSGEVALVFEGHVESVYAVAWSPVGSRVASAGVDEEILMWDPATGIRLSTSSEGHAAPVNSLNWLLNGDTLASGSDDGNMRTWDITGRLVATYELGESGVASVAWFPSGIFIVSGHQNGAISAWSTDKPGTIREFIYAQYGHDESDISDLDMTEEGILVSGGSDWRINVWRAHETAPLASMEVQAGVLQTVWNLDGSEVIFATSNGEISSWVVGSDNFDVHITDFVPGIHAMSISPDETRVATAQYTKLVVQDLRDKSTLFEIEHDAEVHAVAWSPDGKLIATGVGWGDAAVYIWDAETGAQVAVFDDPAGDVHALAWSPDGNQLAAGSADATLRIWDMRTLSQTDLLTGNRGAGVVALAWSPDGAWLASGSDNGTLLIWDMDSKTMAVYLDGSDLSAEEDLALPMTLAFSPDSRMLATVNEDGLVRIWDVVHEGAQIISLTPDGQNATGLAWSADGAFLVAGIDYTWVQIWDTENWVGIGGFDMGNNTANEIGWLSSGEIVTGSLDGTLRVWGVSEIEVTATPDR